MKRGGCVRKEGLGTSSTSKKNPSVLFSVRAAVNFRKHLEEPISIYRDNFKIVKLEFNVIFQIADF